MKAFKKIEVDFIGTVGISRFGLELDREPLGELLARELEMNREEYEQAEVVAHVSLVIERMDKPAVSSAGPRAAEGRLGKREIHAISVKDRGPVCEADARRDFGGRGPAQVWVEEKGHE